MNGLTGLGRHELIARIEELQRQVVEAGKSIESLAEDAARADKGTKIAERVIGELGVKLTLAERELAAANRNLDDQILRYGQAEQRTAEAIAAHFRKTARQFDCQSNPGIQCEACVRDNAAGEVEGGDWRPAGTEGVSDGTD